MKTIKVNIPAPLRKYTSGQPSLEVAGDSVKEVIDNLCAANPEFRKVILNPTGDLSKFINIFIDEDNINDLDHLETSVAGSKEVSIIQALAGG